MWAAGVSNLALQDMIHLLQQQPWVSQPGVGQLQAHASRRAWLLSMWPTVAAGLAQALRQQQEMSDMPQCNEAAALAQRLLQFAIEAALDDDHSSAAATARASSDAEACGNGWRDLFCAMDE